jgi:hypothetical protein
LESKISELLGVLNGTIGNGDLQAALKVEAGQCAWKIAEQLGPGSKAVAVKRLDREMMSYLTVKPAKVNLNQESEIYADFTWLYASTFAVVGINDEDNQTSASASDALEMLRGSQKAVPRGTKYVEIGTRGKQHLMRLNRTRVSRSAFAGARHAIADRFGKSKAAWAATAMEYLSRKFPQWIVNQVANVRANGKHVLNDAGLQNESPFIEFGSRAKGVESNPAIAAAINSGIRGSQETLKAKIQKLLAGYTYNWNTGQVFCKTDFEE